MTAPASSGAATDFDAIATIYDGIFASHIQEHYLRQRIAYIQRHVPPRTGTAVTALDVGAGTGLLAERLTDAGLDVVALDPFPLMLEQVQGRRPELRTVVASGEAIPFPEASFELTYSVAVLHHIAEPERVRRTLAEMVRVTRPGGRILIWDHNPLNPYWPLLMKRVPQDVGTERLVPLREVVAGLEASGATVLRAERRGLMPEFVPRALLAAAARAEALVEATPGLRALCSHNVVLAAKP